MTADMTFVLTDDQKALKTAVYELCKQYPAEYWRDLDTRREYPEAFVNELTKAGYLAVLIPEEYGGGGLGIMEAALILETIARAGGNPAACHAQMYIMGTVLRHGSEAQKKQYLPKIATGELRLQAFGVTEPDAGSDTTKLKTTAVRRGDRYVVNGRKMFISRAMQSDLMLLLARTTPVEQIARRTDGLSVFLIDIRGIKGLEIRPLRMMMNHSTNALFFDDMEIPATSLIGEEGKGFSYILSGMKVGAILAVAGAIVGEFLGSDKGLGYLMLQVQVTLDTPAMFMAVLLITFMGMALYGLRPVCEIQFSGFAFQCFHQFENHAARYRMRTQGRFHVPLVVRMPYGGGVRALEHLLHRRDAGGAPLAQRRRELNA